ncbi:hypothetical protein L7F22_029869 [Adiantum nelumboides]|nr:hypothetical protein [Adiantum nelumboides]
MKRGHENPSPPESTKQRKYADVDTRGDKQNEPASSQQLTQRGDLQSKEREGYTENEEDNKSPFLLRHQNPQVRLRTLACLYAHEDLLSSNAAGRERLFEALQLQLRREDNMHVAQQIVRLLTHLVISACKFGASDKPDPECNSNFTSARTSSVHDSAQKNCGLDCTDSSHYQDDDALSIPLYYIHSASKKASLRDSTVVLPTPETAVEYVKMLLSYASAETESPTLKLQILRSLYKVAKESSGVGHIILHEHLLGLLASKNPFIRAQTLQVVAVSLDTDSHSNFLFDNEDSIGLFVEYAHDASAVVREASLHSIILLCGKGHLLTEGCLKAAIVLLEDANAIIRSLAVQVVSLWVDHDPKEHTNIAFLEVCKMMTDMDLSVRIEACKAFLTMRNVREDLILQALHKQPLELLNGEKGHLQPSSLDKIPESDVDISRCKEGLNILDRLNMGAFVQGIEDEFFEVRLLMLDVLSHFCGVSTRTCTDIKQVMINLLNDDSSQVRLRAVQKLIHVADCHGLQVNDNDLQVVRLQVHMHLFGVRLSVERMYL